jgi:peroxiredoxin
MSIVPNPIEFPAGLPEPKDDGAAILLTGRPLSRIVLFGSDGLPHNLDELVQERVVLYVYPATGKPGWDPSPDWDAIPGAPGCTVQSLGFRDEFSAFAALGYGVVGMSGQSSDDQREFAARQSIPFLLLSDPTFKVAASLGLPTFVAGATRFYKRLALVIEGATIRKAFYPVFPPQENAARVLTWLRENLILETT